MRKSHEHPSTQARTRFAGQPPFNPISRSSASLCKIWAGVEAGIKLLEICPGTKIVLVTELVPLETLEQLEAQGYHFATLSAPFTREEMQSSSARLVDSPPALCHPQPW
jgi:hypothetical protein